MADDAKTLQERRRDLLRRRIAESGVAASESAKPASICAGERYPLSAGQRRMWFLQAMDASEARRDRVQAHHGLNQIPTRLAE